MQNIKYNVKNYPVKLVKNEGSVSFLIKENKMTIPNLLVKDLPEGEFQVSMSFHVIFALKYNYRNRKYLIVKDENDSIVVSDFEFLLDGQSIEDFTRDSSFYDQFTGKEDTFWESLHQILDEKLLNGEFDEFFGRDGIKWDEDEEKVASLIFSLSSDQPQITRIAKALSLDGKDESELDQEDAVVLDKVIKSSPESAIDKIKKRSWSAIKMKAYQFDEDTGFTNVSNSVKNSLK